MSPATTRATDPAPAPAAPADAADRAARRRAPLVQVRRAPAVLWVAVPVACLLLGIVYPVVLLAGASVQGPDGLTLDVWQRLLANPAFADAAWTTVRIALVSTTLCVVLGAFLAFAVVFVPFPGSRVAARAVEVYLSFPSFLIVLALMFVWGTTGVVAGVLDTLTGGNGPTLTLLQSEWGVVMAEVVYFTPFVMGPLVAAMSLVDRTQLGVAASLGASPWRVVRQVLVPEVTPALLAGGALVLLRTMNEFGIVLFTSAKGVNTLPMVIYSQAISRGNYDVAAVAAVVNMALSLGLYVVYRQVAARALGGPRARR